jgi:hypothetical protein
LGDIKLNEILDLNNDLKLQILNDISKQLLETYVINDKAKEIKLKLMRNYNDGLFDKIKDIHIFANEINNVFQEISKDPHLQVYYDKSALNNIISQRNLNQDEINRINQERYNRFREMNFGFNKLEIFDGNIGYINILGFCQTDFASDTVIAAMNFIANSNLIIFDLRENGGGEPEAVLFLANYFLEAGILWNTIAWPYRKTTEEFWTTDQIVDEKMLDKEIYILISKDTFSAGEDFAYGMKSLGRATLIGETTRGGAHPTGGYTVLDLLVLNIPHGQAINPITKANWEGVGVKPDISIDAELAFDKAYGLALEKSIMNTKDNDKKMFLEFAKAQLESKISNINVDIKILQKYKGKYEKGEIILENSCLYYRSLISKDSKKLKLIPISESIFIFEDKTKSSIGLRFKLNKTTKEIELYFLYISDKRIFKRNRIYD